MNKFRTLWLWLVIAVIVSCLFFILGNRGSLPFKHHFTIMGTEDQLSVEKQQIQEELRSQSPLLNANRSLSNQSMGSLNTTKPMNRSVETTPKPDKVNPPPSNPDPVKVSKLGPHPNNMTGGELIRLGHGLEMIVTEKGEKIWQEYGVQYRPFPFLRKPNDQYYCSSFEAYVPFNESSFFEGRNISLKDVKEKKIILWWSYKDQQAPLDGLQPLAACPDFPCVQTTDRSHTAMSSALIMNGQFIAQQSPPDRRPDQVFVYYQVEAAVSGYFYTGYPFHDSRGWNYAFNWTFTYRRNSDIVMPYGIVRRRVEPVSRDYMAIVANKTGLATWWSSHCETGSQRERYIMELQKYMPVDVYGGCGQFHCARSSDKECLQMVSKKYKFFLAFENAICKDYITEKLFRYLYTDMIVVARASDFSDIIPPEIFLNTADFKSPKELADRLLYLDKHDEEYTKLLKEKDKYFTVFEDYPLTLVTPHFLEYRYQAAPTCELCRRLWNLDKYAKQVPDMEAWHYEAQYQCRSPTDLPRTKIHLSPG